MFRFRSLINMYIILPSVLGLALAGLLLYWACLVNPRSFSFPLLLSLFVVALSLVLLPVYLQAFRNTESLRRSITESERAVRALAAGDFDSMVSRPGQREEMNGLAQALDELAQALHKKFMHLSREKNRLQAAMEAMHNGVIISNGDGRITYINKAAVNFFGVGERKVIGLTLQAALRNFLLNENLETVRRHGEPHAFELNLFYPENRVLQVNMIPLLHTEGDLLTGVLTVLHDITGFRSLERMRSEFVANVSHELRTPLTVIKGYTETLLDEYNWQDPKMAERILTVIDKEAERLSRLLKDLLDLSQIESSKGVMKKQKVDLKNVTEEAVSLLRGHSEAKNLEVKLILPGHELRNVWGDPDWLLQMFIDILENAIKYTPQGGRIEIKLQEKGKELLAAVTDTGIGIPARNIPYIFERFYRVDKGRSRRLGGTGLGLAIVKHILEAHGGHMTVESSVGVGTTFSIYLPLGPVDV